MIQSKMVSSLLYFMTVFYRFCLAGVLQKPENFSCIFHYNIPKPHTLYCSWTPAKETNLDADYTCFRKTSNGTLRKGTFQNYSCVFENVPLSQPYCVQLKAGNHISECINISSSNILKLDPPQLNEVEPVPGMKQMLKVSWMSPQNRPPYDSYSAGTRCQIQYEATMKNHSGEIIVYGPQTSVNLTNLWHCTNYTVALRCIIKASQVWSEWSSGKTGTTEEPAPLEVDLWRIIELHQSSGKRTVHLLWKESEEFPCSGIATNYEIRYSTENKTYFKNTKDTTFTLHLTEGAYLISVAAVNVAGRSPEATLNIPSISEEQMDHQRIVTLNASALKEQMFLEWESSDLNINGYVIEWYNDLEPNSYKRSWQKITNVTKWTSLKGAFIHSKHYCISVYPLLNGEIKVPSSTRTYFHEGIPSEGPSVEPAEKIDKNTATIKWKEIPEAKRNGVVTNYTIFYKSEDGKELGETVNPRVLQYQLKSLQANTKYTVKVMASTAVGGKNGTAVIFITSKLSMVDIILICIFIGMIMCCLLTVGILVAMKRHTLKNILWPPIPHPFIPTTPEKQLPVWRNSPMDETHSISLEIHPCSENWDGLQLLNHENSVKQKNVPDNLCGKEYEVLIGLPAEHDFNSPVLPAQKVGSNHYENIEHQSHLNRQTFNSYLKNSVSTREFLDGENTEWPKPGPLTSCLPNSTACPYVLPEEVEPFKKHQELQDT